MNPCPTADLTLTCRTADAHRFVELGLTPVRVRGPLADLELPRFDPAHSAPLLSAGRHQVAADGVPFYGHTSQSRDGGPVVFAADGTSYIEVPASLDLLPTVRLRMQAYPDSYDLLLGRTYLRNLAATVLALPDPKPWLPVPSHELVAHMGCDCGGRGWFLAEDEDSGFFQIVACDICRQYESDGLAGLLANTAIEAGWP